MNNRMLGLLLVIIVACGVVAIVLNDKPWRIAVLILAVLCAIAGAIGTRRAKA